MNTNVIEQVEKELTRTYVNGISNIEIVSVQKDTIYFTATRFQNFQVKFTASLTPKGKVQKAGIRFYE